MHNSYFKPTLSFIFELFGAMKTKAVHTALMTSLCSPASCCVSLSVWCQAGRVYQSVSAEEKRSAVDESHVREPKQ